MDRVAVFVDAGYVFAQGSVLLAGRKLTRGDVTLQHEAAADAFRGFAEKLSGAGLLRVYWYDGTSTGPTAQHLALAHLDDVKVRLGFVNSVGQQKGVDSSIVTDMIALARNRAISDAVLVSGDEDLRVGVQQAQEFGVRVHLVGIKPSRGSQSLFLLQEADTTHEWTEMEISPFLACQARPLVATGSLTPQGLVPLAPERNGTLVTADLLGNRATDVASALEVAVLAPLIEAFDASPQLPRDVDRQLLAGGRSAIGRDLDSAEKKRIRGLFLAACRRRLVE